MNSALFRTLSVLIVFAFVSLALAEDLGAVKARMDQRLSEVVAIKSRGDAGENNRGFLEARGDGAAAATASTISAENKDREIVYAALAEKTKSSAEEVGRLRARKIAETSPAGVWLQDGVGNWKKK